MLEKYHNTYQRLINLNNEKIINFRTHKKDLIFVYLKRKNNDIDKLKNKKPYINKINLDELGILNEKFDKIFSKN